MSIRSEEAGNAEASRADENAAGVLADIVRAERERFSISLPNIATARLGINTFISSALRGGRLRSQPRFVK